MPMYTHIKNVLPFFTGQHGFYEGKRAEDLLKQGAIKLVEPPKEEYEDRQMTASPEDRMMRSKGRPRK